MTDDSQSAFSNGRIIHAFVQAGGRSSRMGADKAWLEINGHPMIEYTLAAAKPVATSLSIIISADNPNVERYARLAELWRAQLFFDLHNHQGPLGGIHTALKRCDAGDAALVLACDLPFLNSEFLALLCQKHKSGAGNITVPLDAHGRLQPLAAIYDQSCLFAVEKQLAARQLRVDRLFDVMPTEMIPFFDFAHLPDAPQFFLNLNSPQDLAENLPENLNADLPFVVKP